MSRKNIFEIVKEKWNIEVEIKRIYSLLDDRCIKVDLYTSKTVIEFVDDYCFYDWKNRNSYLSTKDMAEDLDIELKSNRIPSALSYFSVLKYLEFACNIIMLCDNRIFKSNNDYKFYAEYRVLKENINIVLEHLNYCSKESIKEEKIILIEKNAPAIAVAEIMDEDIGYKVLEYNHFLLQGDIDRKRAILLELATKYEPIRKNMVNINRQLESDIGFMLNNMHIRHNNKKGVNKKEYVSKMRKNTLESWYDETYQMLLLAFLLNDQTNRKEKINELKSKVKA